jgi:hypothetical protein
MLSVQKIRPALGERAGVVLCLRVGCCVSNPNPVTVFFAMRTVSHRREPIAAPVDFNLHHYQQM